MAICYWCDGSGVVDCDHCGTEEAQTCSECQGTGNVDEDEDEDE